MEFVDRIPVLLLQGEQPEDFGCEAIPFRQTYPIRNWAGWGSLDISIGIPNFDGRTDSNVDRERLLDANEEAP